jgi:hypothetical protein
LGFSLKVGNILVKASGFLRKTIATATNIATYSSKESKNGKASNTMVIDNKFNQTDNNSLIKEK